MQKITRSTKHMCTNIEGLLRNMKGKKINFFDDENGNPMSDKQVRGILAEAQAKGHKLIGSSGCEGFDPFGEGCPGHVIQTLYGIDAKEWDLLKEQTELMVNENLQAEDIIHFDFVKSVIVVTGNREVAFDCLSEATFLELFDK